MLFRSMEWVGTDLAVIALATAAAIEILAYYIPWLDNALDTIATPVAVTAGVIATAAVTPSLPPLLRWALAVIAGGAAAGAIQASTVLLRLKSSAFTGGLANPIVATGELAGSLVMSLLALIVPVVALVIVAGLVVWIVRRSGRVFQAWHERKARQVQAPHS